MPKPSEKSAFSAEELAKFHEVQALRTVTLRSLGDALQVWRDCENKGCRHNKSCQRSDHACLYAAMGKIDPKDKQILRYTLEFRISGVPASEAPAMAQARVEEEMRRMAPYEAGLSGGGA